MRSTNDDYSTLEVDPRQYAEAMSGGNAQAYTPDSTNDKYMIVQTSEASALWDDSLNAYMTAEEACPGFTEYMLQQEPSDRPGRTQTWSAPGYVILAAVLEKITGRAWDSLMQEFFDVMEMTGCGFGVQPSSSVDSVENPWPHKGSSGGLVPVLPTYTSGGEPPMIWPAIGLHCTLLSYSIFPRFFLDGYHAPATIFLSEKRSFDMLLSAWSGRSQHPYTFGGWQHDQTSANGSEYYAAGSNTMNYARAWLLVEQDEAFMSMTNVGGGMGRNAASDALYWIAGYTVNPVEV